MAFFVEFKCGCKVARFNCAYDYKTKDNNLRLLCPKCKEESNRVFFICDECGKESSTDKDGKPFKTFTSKKYCHKCKAIRKRIQDRNCKLKLNPKKCNISIPRPDCKSYLQCLDKICRNLDVVAVHCNDCKNYREDVLDILDYVVADGNSSFAGVESLALPRRKPNATQQQATRC